MGVGSAVTLNQLIDVLQTNKDKSVSFQPIADHLKKVNMYMFINVTVLFLLFQIANVPVRNVSIVYMTE